MVDAGYGAVHQWGPPPPVPADRGRIESGSPRSFVGIAAAVAGGALVLSGLLPWGIASLPDGARRAQFSLNGFGVLSYQPGAREANPAAQVMAEALNRADVMAAPGLSAALLGAVGLAAAVVFLSSQKRSVAAVVATAAGLMAAIVSLAQLANVRGMFDGSSDLAEAHFAAGLGVFAAVFAALALTGLGVSAFVLERGSIARLDRTAPAPAAPSTPVAIATPTTHLAPAAQELSVPGAPAGAWPRLIAAGVDVAIAVVATGCLATLVGFVGDSVVASSPARAIWALLTIFFIAPIPLGYFALSEARSGLTVGKRITGIVTQGPTGLAPSLREALRRNAVHAVIGLALGVTGAAVVLSNSILAVLLVDPLLLVYLVWLTVMAVSAFANPGGNPWRLGVHDRFAHGPTRVVNRSAVPLSPSSVAPLTPWCAAAAIIALLLVLTGITDTAVRVMDVGKSAPAPAAAPTHTVTVQAQAPTVIRQPPAVPRPRPQISTAFPADGTRCPLRYGPTGAYTESAIGNDHTSCPFAEEVRIAYADMGMPGSFQHLMVTSPVTHTSIDMTCGPAAAGFVVCRGGNDAVVYLN